MSESPRVGDWTLRSALMRFAQPHPALSGAVLDNVRRLHAALDPLARELTVNGVITDRRLSITGDGLAPVAEPRPDIRVADLARLARLLPDGPAAVDAYDDVSPLSGAERTAVDLLAVSLDLDELADVLAAWALVAPDDPPVRRVEALARQAFDRLETLGVAREERPPMSGRRGRGGRQG